MADILITPERLEEVAGTFEAGRADTGSMMKALRDALADLDAEWDGAAQTHFYDKCDGVLFPNMQKFIDLLQEVATELRCIATTFRDLDATVVGGGGGGGARRPGGGQYYVQ